MTIHEDAVSSLFDPPGTYALATFGRTHAVILTGSERFRELGYNLFTSGGGKRSTPLPPIHSAEDRLDGIWFCMPEERVTLALTLYFYSRLWRANKRVVLDAEGEHVETVCDNEEALWAEAQQLACDFVVNHMRPDHGALPDYDDDPYAPAEHGMGHAGAAHVADDGA